LIDPFKAEGFSLIESRISCYGACKGVINSVVRTSDVGYLTRRLVEVVQHILVHRTDCISIRGLSVSQNLFIQTRIGRVFTDDLYIGLQCIATRKKEIGIGPVNQFITSTPNIYSNTFYLQEYILDLSIMLWPEPYSW